MADGFAPKTGNGYDLFEASSALQKSIRRGDEHTAMFFAVELWNANFGEYVWKRLKIIASEDVGLAEPNIAANIAALYVNYNEQVKKADGKHNPERLFLTHAVLMLCRAKKSRMVDWTLVTYWRGHDDEMLPIPDYAYDKHNMKGRKMGRGVEHFFEEGTHIENASLQEGEVEMRKRAWEQHKKEGTVKGKVPKDAVQDTLFDE